MQASGRRHQRLLALLPHIGLTAAAVAFLPVVYAAMFKLFQDYDDEGYLLISLKGYLQGAPLYEDVFSQYGPFYFVWWNAILRILGISISHDAGRLLTLAVEATTAWLVGVVVYRLTRTFLLALASLVIVMLVLLVAANEPMHPGSLLSLMLAAMVGLGTAVAGRRRGMALAALGALIAASLLTKINVGAFALIAALFAFTALSSRGRWRGPLLLAVSGVCVLAPLLLMSRTLGEEWALTYGVSTSLACLGVVVVGWWLGPGDLEPREALWLLGSIAVTGGLVLGWTLLRGSGLQSLLDGVVLSPLRHPDAFSLPLPIDGRAIIAGVSSLSLIALWAWGRASARSLQVPCGVVKLLVGIGLWLVMSGVIESISATFTVTAAFAWMAMVPPDPTARPSFVRLFLPALAVLESLQAYPVAGTQVSWSSFLLVAVGAVCIADGISLLGPVLGKAIRHRALHRALLTVPAVAFLSWYVPVKVSPAVTSNRSAYQAGVPLSLPGADRLRIPESQARLYRLVTADLQAECETFVSMPGINSLYFFTGVDPPTFLNTTAWMFLLPHADQATVVAAIEDRRDVCLVTNDSLTGFWSQGKAIPPGPLVDYLSQGFISIVKRDPFVILKRV